MTPKESLEEVHGAHRRQARSQKRDSQEGVQRGRDVHRCANPKPAHLPLIVGVLPRSGEWLVLESLQRYPIAGLEDEAEQFAARVFQSPVLVNRKHRPPLILTHRHLSTEVAAAEWPGASAAIAFAAK
jgi:hypothetical protein